jgi:hypothetical protein
MSQDIDAALKDWEYKPGEVQARLIHALDGRDVIQLRVDLGILQLEQNGRPDGTRPNGFATYLSYLKHEAKTAERAGESLVLSEEQSAESDREFIQYYHRRICWLALRDYPRAIADADHTLEFMDFVQEHSPNEEYTRSHEQYRSFVLYHRTQAAAAMAVEKDDHEGAIDAVHEGLKRLRDFFASHDLEDRMDEDAIVQQLRKMEKVIRKTHNIDATLQEQLEAAIAKEDYEGAAKLRDALRQREAR